MAKQRSSGIGLVITLIIFILLTIAGTGLSIHLYQQWTLAEEAIETNQRAFRDSVGAAFDQAGWDMPERTRDAYGIVYDRDTYTAVALKLNDSALYENMQPLLPWRTAQEVEEALVASAPDAEVFNRVQALLNHYSEQHEALGARIDDLNRRNRAYVRDLEQKDESFREMQADLKRQILASEANHAERLAEFRSQYNAMEQRWRQAREQTGVSFTELRGRMEELESEIAASEERIAEKTKIVEELEKKLVVEEEPARLVAEGEVLTVERGTDLIMVAGGEEAGHQRNEQIVIYRREPNGEPFYIGAAVIAAVYDVISLAHVIADETVHPIIEGQVFVRREAWDEMQSMDLAEVPVRRPQPQEIDRQSPREPLPSDDDDDDTFEF